MATFLLVHGAWHSGRTWDRVVPLLESAGHRVLAPSLTGHGDKAHLLGPEVGLGTHIDDVADLIEGERLDDVVLVGHSYAGMVISGVAHQVPKRIAHLVFLDAMVPEDGDTAVDVLPTQQLVDVADRRPLPPAEASPGAHSSPRVRRRERHALTRCRRPVLSADPARASPRHRVATQPTT